MSGESLQAEAVVEEVSTSAEAAPEPTEGAIENVEQDNSPESESSEEVSEVKEEEKPKELSEVDKIKHSMQKRIDRKTAATKALESKVRELQQQVETYQGQAPKVDNTPKEEDFETWAEYKDALVKHEAKQMVQDELEQRRRQEIKVKQAEIRRRQEDEFNRRVDDFRKLAPDYDEKANAFMDIAQDYQRRLGSTPTMQAISQVLVEVENAPALIHKLGGEPDLVDMLVDMTPVQAAFELFKIHEGYSQPQEEKALSKPIKPVKATGRVSKNVNHMSPDELMDWMQS